MTANLVPLRYSMLHSGTLTDEFDDILNLSTIFPAFVGSAPPTLKLALSTDKSLVADTGGITLSFARATEASYFDAAGVLQTAASGAARFDHNPSTLASLGLLVEGARTNIMGNTEVIIGTATDWTISQAASTTNDAVAPDGNTTADKLADSGATGTGTPYIRQEMTVVATTTYTFSVFAKSDQTDWIRLRIFGAGALTVHCYYDLATPAKGTPSAGVDASGIQACSNGWVRCWLTWTQPAADTAVSARIYIANADNDDTVNLDGTNSVHLWGSQIEAGENPSSYIENTADQPATATRNADVPTTTSLAWLDAAATVTGTFYVEGSFLAAGVAARPILTLDDGGTTDRIAIELDASENINAASTHSADTDGLVSGTNVIAAGATFRAAVAYADDDLAMAVDGTQETSDTTAAFPLGDNPTTLRVGHDTAATFFGHVAEIRYYASRLTDADLVSVSTDGVL